MGLDEVFDYFRSYDKSSFHVVACQGNEPTERDVADFERAIGFTLPEDFRAFTTSPLGGLYIEVRENLWPAAEPFAVGPFWSFLRGLQVFGIANGIPDWLDIRVQFKKFVDDGHPSVVPFLKIEGDADWYCFDRSGAIVRWNHEQDSFEPVELGFSELLLHELRELEERKDRKLRDKDSVPSRS